MASFATTQASNHFLPDGSQLTLLDAAYGTNHVVVAIGGGLRFHPILRNAPQKIVPRVMTFTSGSGDTVMVWLRRDGGLFLV
jgi:hypothetical protein